MRVFIIISVIIFFFLPVSSEGFAKEKQIIVVFRYDDYSGLSSTELEIRIIRVFQKYKIPCTFGVIPFTVAKQLDTSPQNIFPLSQPKAALLKNAMKDGTLEIAQHGYSHQTISKKGIYSEFYGLDYDDQLKKIEKGKKYLEETLYAQITTFIPPFNTYDLNTIRVLERLGFNCISSSLDGDAAEFSGIHFLPETCNILQLKDAVKTARNIRDPQPIIAVMFHGYDFVEIDKGRGTFTYQEFLNVLNWITSQSDVRVMTIRQANNTVSDLSATRFLMNRAVKSSLYFMPPFLRNTGSNNSGLYFSSGDSMDIRAGNRIYVIALYIMILMISTGVSFYTASLVFPESGYLISAFRYGAIALLVFFSIYTFQDSDIGYKGAMVITVCSGTCIGIWSSFFITRKRNRSHDGIKEAKS